MRKANSLHGIRSTMVSERGWLHAILFKRCGRIKIVVAFISVEYGKRLGACSGMMDGV